MFDNSLTKKENEMIKIFKSSSLNKKENTIPQPAMQSEKTTLLWKQTILKSLGPKCTFAFQGFSHSEFLSKILDYEGTHNLIPKNISNFAKLPETTKREIQYLDALWQIQNALSFTVSAEDFIENKFSLGTCEDLVSMKSSLFINAKLTSSSKTEYLPIAIFAEKSEVPVFLHKEKQVDSYNVFLFLNDNHNAPMERTFVHLLIIADLFPRVYVQKNSCKDCETCEFKNNQPLFIAKDIDSPDRNHLKKDNNFCMVGKNLASKCPRYQNYSPSIPMILNCVFHICYLYNHRYSLDKPKTSLTSSRGVLLSCTSKTGEYHDVPITEYAHTPLETERPAPKGGHHRPPREHHRTGFFRHYKNGKVVYIRETTVNKGKNYGKVSFSIPKIKNIE